ncbi:MAG: (deoxy)nucleoside triphosphate pyrophosphohydrolase [Leptotrichiaceae bacterium]|nr:(deoxy)nucleoside triphosphate pyrophosphohydrolase [Leptotrichiaceae bacterium]
MTKKLIKVVGAIIENQNNEILCALRKKDGILGNYWEFPGGKLEENEDIFQCIKREIKEELGIEFLILNNVIYSDDTYEYDNFIVQLFTVKGSIEKNLSPSSSDHDSIIWLKRENLLSLNWAPADIPAVNSLVSECYN